LSFRELPSLLHLRSPCFVSKFARRFQGIFSGTTQPGRFRLIEEVFLRFFPDEKPVSKRAMQPTYSTSEFPFHLANGNQLRSVFARLDCSIESAIRRRPPREALGDGCAFLAICHAEYPPFPLENLSLPARQGHPSLAKFLSPGVVYRPQIVQVSRSIVNPF